MKKVIFLLLFSQLLFSQYSFKSPYLQNPEKVYGYVDSCAKFWMKAYDPAYGGFYVNINRQGNLSGSNIKNTLNQSRDAYGFIRAFQLTGDTLYLRYARYALNFMYKYGWDKNYGGWLNDIGNTGNAVSPSAAKTAFYQHYAMLGIMAQYEATRDTMDWNWLMKSYDYNESKFWDSDAVNFGYYDYVSADGSNPTDKTFNSTVDAITTHVLHLYLMTGEQKYKTRLLQLADNMINRLAASSSQQKIGFAEAYTKTWQIKSGTSDETRTIMGHVLKTAWCLARIYLIEKNPLYLSTAESLVKNVLDNGYDFQNGGPYKDYNRINGQMMMYGITDTAKAWWQMEQAVTAGLMLYHITGKETYLKMADETLDFFMKYFVDHVYGDVYENTNKYGGIIQQWGTTKGNSGKAGYHSIETGYYTYLYGKLLARKEPAALSYFFSAQSQPRQLKMRPVGLPDGYLKITSVLRNGTKYINYDSTNLVLNIPANIDGIFTVTYSPSVNPLNITHASTAPAEYYLSQNYPNPFNPSTSIEYSLTKECNVKITLINSLGQKVKEIINEFKQAGNYRIVVDCKELTSGVYFYQLQAGNYMTAKKMLLLR